MDTKSLQEKFSEMHLLDRKERIDLINMLNDRKPDFLQKFAPKWWWWNRCKTNVLIVADGGLNFGTTSFGLSEFLTAFNELESKTFVDYRVTLAHRSTINQSLNPVVVNHIDNFDFSSSADLMEFDQIWLFAIDPNRNLSTAEVRAISDYMDQGGGLFATGDHGALGRGMCGEIPRVKDMRYWESFPTPVNNLTNEVSMTGPRRNDTNVPHPGDGIADTFAHQADVYPQTIGVRTFGQGMSHPLLSISQNKRPSGIIDIMPDHPHEGECKPETSFSVNGVDIPTQILATSFVNGGNTSGRKTETAPHCFPSIAVWDGRRARAGRIVVDSTWHHFVNINLLGLNNQDFDVIRQYYMNIVTWMSRWRFRLCWIRWEYWKLFRESQLVEAALDNPIKKISEITLSELGFIGGLAEELLAEKFGPAAARDIMVDMATASGGEWAELMVGWNPELRGQAQGSNTLDMNWINLDYYFHTAVGRGFIEMRDDKKLSDLDPKEKSAERIPKVFSQGLKAGSEMATKSLAGAVSSLEPQLR